MSTYQKKKPTVVPWSYSRLTAFETCPRRFYLTSIAKVVKEEQTQATLHGNEVHKALELYVGGKAALPTKYASYKPIADKIRMAPGTKHLEYKFGLTKMLQPTTFFADDVWCRGVLDVGVVREKSATALDWKTGKRKLDSQQLKLFAGASFALWPHIQTVKTGFIWLPTNQMDTEVFTRDQMKPIFQEFAIRVHRMELAEKNDDWPANPSGLCREWCPVGRSLCEHCGKP